MPKYSPQKIEKKWQRFWAKNKINSPALARAKRPFYNLMMFPYPSAEGLHVGNMYAFVHSDAYGRFMKLRGYDVFEPVGLDGFGIHSENYAIKKGQHILDVSARTEKHFYEQLHMIGNQYDWTRHLETYKPDYYKWTQWLFVQMFKKGLAYQAESNVNWCPSCKTVLSDEQVIAGKCERCAALVEKKMMRQWFFKITDYAERLLKNLDSLSDGALGPNVKITDEMKKTGINWSERTKTAQRNWIGKSEGAQFRMQIAVNTTPASGHPSSDEEGTGEALNEYFEVFTTRLDTVFGMTYVVLAPEHPLIKNYESRITNYEEVEKYVAQAKKKSEMERAAGWQKVPPQSGEDARNYNSAESGENFGNKTGVELKGIKAVNPFNNEKIPVFAADYVLGHYGTGAVMAVPAHDERDWEFAKKYNLPIREVILPKNQEVVGVGALIRDKDGKFLFQERDNNTRINPGMIAPFGGAIEKNESHLDALSRELKEELNLEINKTKTFVIGKFKSHVYQGKFINLFYTELITNENIKLQEGSRIVRFSLDEAIKNDKATDFTKEVIRYFQAFNYLVFDEDGILMDSNDYNGTASAEAREKMTKWIEKNRIGTRKINYKLRDWCISRQRYWGPPIPMIHCPACAQASAGKENAGWQVVPEKDLPVLLPKTKDYLPRPDGLAPLARNEKFWRVKCPKCGKQARRETDVSDTFLDSAWYFLRYPSVGLKNKIFDEKITRRWLPVDMYIGGHEHAVLHLLYSRFMTMFLKDLGLIDFEEPYKRFFAHGLLVREGAKMSKSKGNVINPDEYIKKYGADAVRMYLMFMGDVNQGGDWRDSGMQGMYRFIIRVWKLQSRIKNKESRIKNREIELSLHKTIKKITSDLENLKFNTAISALMILVNAFEKEAEIPLTLYSQFLILLSPFAPHIAEELWSRIGKKKSIFTEKWPEYDAKLVKDETIQLIIQINGKLRDKIEVAPDISEADARATALTSEKIKSFLAGKEPKKVIFVKGRLINIVT